MISYELYKLVHIVAALVLFMSLGGVAMHAMNGGTRANNPSRGFAAAWHGIGLVFLLIAGFGMLARLGMTGGFDGWVWGKIAIWIVLAGLLFLLGRRPDAGRALWLVAAALGTTAVYLAIYKPF